MQTHATLLDVTCCVRLHTLLRVVAWCCVLFVAQSLKSVKLLSEELPNSLLLHDCQSIAQQSQICLHTSSNIVGAMHVYYTWSPSSLQSLMVLWVYPSHGALQVLTSNNVGSCCVCLHVAHFLFISLNFNDFVTKFAIWKLCYIPLLKICPHFKLRSFLFFSTD